MHIPPEKLLPQDLIDIFDHGPEKHPHPAPVKIRMHATDAKHAMSVEPGRWKMHGGKPELHVVAAAPEED
jgi:hypothetical protein